MLFTPEDGPMIRSAFSTVACPGWTLDRVVSSARTWCFDAVELRTTGFGTSPLACEPAHTSAAKVRRIFDEGGVSIASLATDLCFDEPIRPPVIGLAIGDHERSVRRARLMVDLAAEIESASVRVFAGTKHGREHMTTCRRRISQRLFKVVDHSRTTGVRVLLENAASFPTASSLVEIIAASDLEGLLGVSYNVASARAGGESLGQGLDVLGDRIDSVRLCARDDRQTLRSAIVELRTRGFSGWVVFEDDQLWAGDQGDPGQTLDGLAELVVEARERVA